MTPDEYRHKLSTLGRGAALRQGSAPRPLATPIHVRSNHSLLLRLEERGLRQSNCSFSTTFKAGRLVRFSLDCEL